MFHPTRLSEEREGFENRDSLQDTLYDLVSGYWIVFTDVIVDSRQGPPRPQA